MTKHQGPPVADAATREKALDVNQSFIVQAPAGSGKTELLIQRILALLAVADSPEEILAITFTRKAAGEMKIRLLEALERGISDEVPAEQHKRETWERARKVLQRDRDRSWNLPENPSRLQIMTIDSFCSSLSRRMPWLARLGDQPGVVEDADDLYQQAAENLLAKLESDSGCSNSIAYMLQHLDNRMVQLRQLLVSMLARRDQWIRYLINEKDHSKSILETALENFALDTVDTARQALGERRLSGAAAIGSLCCGQPGGVGLRTYTFNISRLFRRSHRARIISAVVGSLQPAADRQRFSAEEGRC